MESTLSRQVVARIGAALYVICGAVAALGLLLPAPAEMNRSGMALTILAALLSGVVVWLLPWHRWPRQANLALVPYTFALIAVHNYYAGLDPYRYGIYFSVSFIWLGIGHHRGTSLRFAPLAAAAYLIPLLAAHRSVLAVSSVAFVIPVCVLAGETLAWVSMRLRTIQRIARAGEARLAAILETSPDLIATIDQEGRYVYVNEAHHRVLGRDPGDLIGHFADSLIHPHDLRRARTRFRQRMDETAPANPNPPGVTYRMQHADGSWMPFEIRTRTQYDRAGAPSGLLLFARDVTERSALEERLKREAHYDSLTALPNRTLLMQRLEATSDRSRRRRETAALLFLDLDRFKVVNDSLGHAQGDALLAAVAERLGGCLRPQDTLARFGGDEFIVLAERSSGARGAEWLAGRLLEALREPFTVEGQSVFTPASIGITLIDGSGASPDDLVREASIALYEAKAGGRAGYRVFTAEMAAGRAERLRLESDLRLALERNEFRVFFQPELDLRSGRVVGMEALVRWQHPRRGLIPPAAFIPLAEETGLILQIGPRVVAEACRNLRAWQQELTGGPPLVVSVNLSAREFACAELYAGVAQIVVETGIDPTWLRLEITESAVMQDVAAAARTLQRLSGLGVQLAIDDFGTGYSSLSYLRQFPVGTLKIDRSFVTGLEDDKGAVSIVGAVATLGHALGMDVTIEGIETPAQLELVRAAGCDRAQGYLYSPPVPAAAMLTILRADRGNDTLGPIDLTERAVRLLAS